LVKLKKENKIKRAGGRDIRFTIRYTDLGTAEAIDPAGQVSFQQVDTRTAGVLDWKYYKAQTMMNWDQRVQNDGDKFRAINLIKDLTSELKEEFYNKMATDLYTANPNGNGFAALPTIVDATDAYAGIYPSDAANWAATESTETTLTLFSGTQSLAYMVAQATFGKHAPTIHITTRNLQNKFESLMYDQVRYEDKEMANAGFQNVTFKGAPVIGDAHCPASSWWGLDTDCMELLVHSDYGPKIGDWMELDVAGYPNSLVKLLTWAGNLVSKRRNTHFKYTALVYTN
jgi:hypothetical protein